VAFDGTQERFVGDDETNKLLGRKISRAVRAAG
jgi:hypothetical protein